ncbi:C40 family peptidase [Chromohalobacter canadensis]|uniref:C40 family peptidase n=1 Tax=Chromohalobacter canadensis TaxID=141389 RepID=A0ABZ0YEB6_9GAMM|nr:C40 family peptidase [Chromohalobacter canadensis]MCK0770269.1 C40 family peptidase [Chromohalobacter canadensis]WQH10441.1 C40 family peptidase [Chromohalobacter canadensis]
MESDPVTHSSSAAVAAPRLQATLTLLLCLLVLAGCSSSQRIETHDPGPTTAEGLSIERALIISNAKQALGTPYKWGGNSLETGVDCSGLVQVAYHAAGIDVPRTSNQQYQTLDHREQARPGDLLFFGSGSRATHVGIYLGDRRMIHAPGSGREVTVSSLNIRYWRQHYLGAAGPAP